MKEYKLLQGDCLEQLKRLPDNSIDSIITDPPAGIGFMGKKWDGDKGGKKQWIAWMEEVFIEVLRVLKPGAAGLVWALPRNSHWTGSALEDAGFEIRDVVQHVFGSGFPKSHNIGKSVDKKLGNDRDVVGENPNARPNSHLGKDTNSQWKVSPYDPLTKGTSEWEGWGTGLKPSSEFWWLIRKPLSEKTIVDNVLKWGVGGLNIDASRIGSESVPQKNHKGNVWGEKEKDYKNLNWTYKQGRFPSHLIHDGSEEVLEEFAKAGVSKSSKSISNRKSYKDTGTSYIMPRVNNVNEGHNDKGTPARFFYCAKPSSREKNLGLDEFEDKVIKGRDEGQDERNTPYKKRTSPQKNIHPTVKSIKLMNYLITMITPPNGIVLDPFMGSGSTGIAARLNGNRFIGIDLEKEYIDIAEARINNYEKYRQFL